MTWICSKCLLYLSQILFFSLPVFERYDTEAKISNFSSLIWCVVTLFFIQALQNATFAVKNTAVSQKLSKLAIFHLFSRDFFFLSFPVFERYDTEAKISNFLPFVCLFVKLDTYLAYLSPISLYSNDMTPNARNLKKTPVFLHFLNSLCLLSWTHVWHIFLKSPCIRTI